jgi:hypothetical protein
MSIPLPSRIGIERSTDANVLCRQSADPILQVLTQKKTSQHLTDQMDRMVNRAGRTAGHTEIGQLSNDRE